MSKITILCVDDEKIVLDTLKKQIKYIFGDKYHYEIAESADEAWEVLEELNNEHDVPCLVLSDYLMPGTRGDEFLVKVHNTFPKTVKILLTGQVDIETMEKIKKELPLHRSLIKPWELKDIIEAVESGIEKLNNL